MSGRHTIKRLSTAAFDLIPVIALIGTMSGMALAETPPPGPVMERPAVIPPRLPRPASRVSAPVSARPGTVSANPGNPAPARPNASSGVYFAET